MNYERKYIIDHLYVSKSVVHKLSDHRDKCKNDKDVLRAIDDCRICL